MNLNNFYKFIRHFEFCKGDHRFVISDPRKKQKVTKRKNIKRNNNKFCKSEKKYTKLYKNRTKGIKLSKNCKISFKKSAKSIKYREISKEKLRIYITVEQEPLNLFKIVQKPRILKIRGKKIKLVKLRIKPRNSLKILYHFQQY